MRKEGYVPTCVLCWNTQNEHPKDPCWCMPMNAHVSKIFVSWWTLKVFTDRDSVGKHVHQTHPTTTTFRRKQETFQTSSHDFSPNKSPPPWRLKSTHHNTNPGKPMAMPGAVPGSGKTGLVKFLGSKIFRWFPKKRGGEKWSQRKGGFLTLPCWFAKTQTFTVGK